MDLPEHRTKADLVRAYAGFFESRGYRIDAALPEFVAPEAIDSVVPDLVATRHGHRVVLQAETPESVEGAIARRQSQVLRAHCKQIGAKFILAVTDGRVLK